MPPNLAARRSPVYEVSTVTPPRSRLEAETRAYVASYTAPPRCQSYARALESIAGRMDSAGRVRDMSHARLGRVLGLSERQVQRIVHALRAAGMLRIDAQRGFANVYRVLVDWVLRLIAGESVTGHQPAVPDAHETPQTVPASAPTHPPPWIFARSLDRHPDL